MSFELVKGKNVDVFVWAPPAEIEAQALDQLRNVSALPWVFHHVAAMADVHVGKGATIGSVVALRDAVAPSAVGVDIGCGCGAVRTNLRLSDVHRKLRLIYDRLVETIPVGPVGYERSWHDKLPNNPILDNDMTKLMERFAGLTDSLTDGPKKATQQLGTLGGGNHFLELCVDADDRIWLTLHSGSRNIGKVLAEIHISKAMKLTHNQSIPDRDLAVFLSGTPEMDSYRNDLSFAQDYAFLNRRIMLHGMQTIVSEFFPSAAFDEAVICHHNFCVEEVHFGENVFVTRKGAIRAQVGDMGMIPGAMGGKTFIIRGKGNPDSFNSCAHGAGRRMSRTKAKQKYTVDDLIKQTDGVICRKDKDVIDEIPSSYKDVEKVMERQSDLVEIVAELKCVVNVKG